jgi:hypothetical protein
MIAYKKTGGLAHDLILVPEDYKPAADEFLIPGDEMPALESLCDPKALSESITQSDLAAKRRLALIALDDARLAAAVSESSSPQAVKDYAAACSAQPLPLAESGSPIVP